MKKSTNKLYDIAIQKFNAITTAPKGEDYANFYLILQKNNWPISRIREDAAMNFGVPMYVDTIHLAKQFLRVVEFRLPRMLVPFDQKRMEEFFLSEAKKLKKEILK